MLENWKIPLVPSIHSWFQEWHAQCLTSATAIAYQSSTLCSVAADLESLLGLVAVSANQPEKKAMILEDPTKYCFFLKLGRESDSGSLFYSYEDLNWFT